MPGREQRCFYLLKGLLSLLCPLEGLLVFCRQVQGFGPFSEPRNPQSAEPG